MQLAHVVFGQGRITRLAGFEQVEILQEPVAAAFNYGLKNKVKDAKFVVFHDAYQYFEERFGVRAAGALTLNTDVLPGAKQIDEIQDVIKDKGIKCIFSEPQFNPDIINAVAKDMKIKTGVLDPLGATLDSGKDLYFKLIRNMSASFKGC